MEQTERLVLGRVGFVVALGAEEALELGAEIVGRWDRGLGAAVVLLLEHRARRCRAADPFDDLVVELAPAVDVVARSVATVIPST